jgi:hypothetical protein
MSRSIEDRDGTPVSLGDRVQIVGLVTDILLPALQLVITTEEGFEVVAPARAAVRQDED